MAVIDKFACLLWDTALNTGVAGTYLVGDQLDLKYATQALNQADMDYRDLYLVAKVTTTATSAGSATLQLSVASDDTAAVSTTTSTVHYTTTAVPVASLVAGYEVFCLKLPRHPVGYERFLGILQITGTAAFTAGKLSVYLTDSPGKFIAYPDGFTGTFSAS